RDRQRSPRRLSERRRPPSGPSPRSGGLLVAIRYGKVLHALALRLREQAHQLQNVGGDVVADVQAERLGRFERDAVVVGPRSAGQQTGELLALLGSEI